MSDHHAPPPRVPAQVAPAETPGLNSLLTLCVCVVVVAALYLAREVLIPITVAILLSFVLAPVVDLLRGAACPTYRRSFSRSSSGSATLLTIAGLSAYRSQVSTDDVPQYAATIDKKVETIRAQLSADCPS